MIQIEDFLLKNSNIDELFNFYQKNEFLTKNFTFYARLFTEHPSQLKNSSVIVEGNLNHLLNILKYFYDSNKMISISIEMLSEKVFNDLKKSHNGTNDRKYIFST